MVAQSQIGECFLTRQYHGGNTRGTLSEHIFLQHHDTLEFFLCFCSFEQQLYVKVFFSPPNLSNLSLALKL